MYKLSFIEQIHACFGDLGYRRIMYGFIYFVKKKEMVKKVFYLIHFTRIFTYQIITKESYLWSF